MLGEFVTRCLVLLFGYAYPAFECFKSVEKNRFDNQELRFWCQYWIIVAILTVCERLADIFFAWLPVYDEVKLGFIIYLWYSKTKGTGYIYDTLLRPLVAKHETDIEDKLNNLKARVWDFAIYYWQNCTQLGQTAFFQVLDYLAAQSGRFASSRIEQQKQANKYEPSAPPMPPDGEFPPSSSKNSRRRPSRPPPSRGTTNRAVSESPVSNLFQFHLNEKTETSHMEEVDADYAFPETDLNDDKSHHQHQSRMARFLRRSRPI